MDERPRTCIGTGGAWDLLHGHLTLKHIVDWVVLRRQSVDWDTFHARCEAFKFDKFLPLIDALADVVEGKMEYQALQPSYQEVFDEIFKTPVAKSPRSWFGRRVELFFSILCNGKKYRLRVYRLLLMVFGFGL